jgi:hypothetical protein
VYPSQSNLLPTKNVLPNIDSEQHILQNKFKLIQIEKKKNEAENKNYRFSSNSSGSSSNNSRDSEINDDDKEKICFLKLSLNYSWITMELIIRNESHEVPLGRIIKHPLLNPIHYSIQYVQRYSKSNNFGFHVPKFISIFQISKQINKRTSSNKLFHLDSSLSSQSLSPLSSQSSSESLPHLPPNLKLTKNENINTNVHTTKDNIYKFNKQIKFIVKDKKSKNIVASIEKQKFVSNLQTQYKIKYEYGSSYEKMLIFCSIFLIAE